MSKELEEEQRLRREKAELLKLRQGIIEESEMIPQNGAAEIEKPHGWKRVENFFYHYWAIVLVVVGAAIAVGYMTVSTITKEKNDLYVLAVSTQTASGIFAKTDDIERALERYCPDFDGNGYVHVGVNYISLSTENGVSEYTDAENYKFTSEIIAGDSQLFIADEGIIALLEGKIDENIQFFYDFSEEFPEAALTEGVGLRLNTTGFKDEARWQSCPDILGVYARNEFYNMTGNDDDAKEQRRRAMEVYRNIATGNIVNPASED